MRALGLCACVRADVRVCVEREKTEISIKYARTSHVRERADPGVRRARRFCKDVQNSCKTVSRTHIFALLQP